MEYWDIYDEKKQKTGRTMKRNDWNMKPDEYHLTVLGVLKKLSNLKTTKAFNKHLEQLLMISPRKSRHVSELLANSPDDFEKIIDRETDLLTAMEMVSPCATGSFKGQQIEVYNATDSQKQEVYEHLIPSLQSKVKHIWRVIPQKQQRLFNDYCGEKHIRYVRQMWHGS